MPEVRMEFMEMTRKNTITILMIVIIGVTLFVGLEHYAEVRAAVDTVFFVLTPFIIGAALAFILNVPMRAIENLLRRVFEKKKKPLPDGFYRGVALFVTVIIFIGIITAILFLIIPEIGRTISVIIERFPGFVKRMEGQLNELAVQYPAVSTFLSGYRIDWDQLAQNAVTFLKTTGSDIFGSAVGFASSVAGVLINIMIGIVFAVNILLQKNRLARQAKKIAYAYLKENKADQLMRIAKLSDDTFSHFLSGQGLESLIVIALFLISMTVLQLPYALLISVLLGVMAFIPVVGPFIGCMLGTFFILIVDPVKAVWFLILFVVEQQIEGNLIYPRVMGSSIGLPPMWVLVALVVGAFFTGIGGMLFFIPLASVVCVLFREAVNRRLVEKGVPDLKTKA
jgi:predicted PurR-regulated permease PerM